MIKFDYVIGNPPYQEDRKGDSNTALPVYHEFMQAAFEIGTAVELITPARFLFNAGGTPKQWNKQVLSDDHFKVMEYIEDASLIFKNKDIKGGVVISYRDCSKQYRPIGIFTVDNTVNKIISKAGATSLEKSVGAICFVATKFNIRNLERDYSEYSGHERRMSSNVLPFKCFHDIENDEDILIYGNYKSKRCGRYTSQKYVDLSDVAIQQYKVIVPKADGNGAFGDTITNPELLRPRSGFTHTFLGIGGFDTLAEAQAAMKYIKTKFARALLSVLKVTQDVNAQKWSLVPLQDFSEQSDIDWTTNISAIDHQLYKKYGLTSDEINFIESHVKEME